MTTTLVVFSDKIENFWDVNTSHVLTHHRTAGDSDKTPDGAAVVTSPPGQIPDKGSSNNYFTSVNVCTSSEKDNELIAHYLHLSMRASFY